MKDEIFVPLPKAKKEGKKILVQVKISADIVALMDKECKSRGSTRTDVVEYGIKKFLAHVNPREALKLGIGEKSD
jgi:hypothetical protein